MQGYMLFNSLLNIEVMEGLQCNSGTLLTKRLRSLISAHGGVDIHILLHNASQHALYLKEALSEKTRNLGI